MNNLTTVALQYLAIYLVHSTILLGCTWLLLRRRAGSDHWVHDRGWKWAAAAGLITTTFQMVGGWASPILELPFSLTSERAVVSQVATDSDLRIELRDDHDRPRIEPAPGASTDHRIQDSKDHASDFGSRSSPGNLQPIVVDPIRQSADSPPSKVEHPQSDSASYAAVGWFGLLAVALLSIHGVVRGALQNRWWRRQLSQAKAARGRVERVLRNLIRDAGIRRHVELFVSKDYPEPMAMGIRRWMILLPEGIEHELTDEQLRALFAHELAHLIRRDPLWLWIGHGLCSLLAIQPLNFLARRRWKAAAEFVCDDWAIRQGVTRLSLAQCLTTVAEWRMNRQVRLGALAAGGSPASLPQRVERLLDEQELDAWRSPWRRATWSVAVLLVVGAFALFAPRFVKAGLEESPPNAAAASETGDRSDAEDPAENASQGAVTVRSQNHPSLTELDREIRAVRGEIEQLKRLLLKNEQAGTAESVSRLDRSLKSLKVHYEALRNLTQQLRKH